MAENPYVNKVIYGDQTLIDLTDDTVSPSSLKLGSTAHDASGAQITGTADDAPKRTLAYIFDSSDSYAVSDYVYYEDKLYRCIVAHSGTWNSEHFVETTIGDELNDKMAEMTILSYGKSTWNDFLTAYTRNKVVYCRASSNANPATGSQTRLAFMAYVNNETNPTNVEFQYYRSVSSHTASQQGDQVYVYKLDKTAGWTVTTREASSKIVAGTNMSSSYSNGTLTLDATDTTYESKAAASGGTDLSLVTTGEKYNWNARGVPSGGTTGQVLKKSSNSDYATEWADESGGSQFFVSVQRSNGQYISDKTLKEIADAIEDGYAVVVKYDADYYCLGSYSQSSTAKSVSFLNNRYVQSSGGIQATSLSMYGGDNVNTFTLSSFITARIELPQHSNPFCSVYYDDEHSKYVFQYEGKMSFDEVFANGNIDDEPVLFWQKSAYDPYGSEPTDANSAVYTLTDAYTTNEDWSYTGHLVFSRVVVVGAAPKIERFEISQDFGAYDSFASATVTYSEISLGAPPSASGVSF